MIGRREFITLVGGAAATWPLAAQAQQTAIPVIGYLNLGSPESDTSRLTGLRRGLNETGYVEGRNFVIEYRWAGNQPHRLPALAADLVYPDAGRARRVLNLATIEGMAKAFEKGGQKAIDKVMTQQPAIFLKMLVLLVPRELEVSHSNAIKQMSD